MGTRTRRDAPVLRSADERTIRDAILQTLRGIEPEMAPDSLNPAAPLRAQIDLDSIDFLNFLIALQERLGIEIPETDYAEMQTLDSIIAYLARRLSF